MASVISLSGGRTVPRFLQPAIRSIPAARTSVNTIISAFFIAYTSLKMCQRPAFSVVNIGEQYKLYPILPILSNQLPFALFPLP